MHEYILGVQQPNVMGQLAAAECGIAMAVITRFSLLPGLKVLDAGKGLPERPALGVVFRDASSRNAQAPLTQCVSAGVKLTPSGSDLNRR